MKRLYSNSMKRIHSMDKKEFTMKFSTSTRFGIATLATLALLIVGSGISAQGANNQNNQNNQQAEDLKDWPLNDFEAAEDWRAFATSPLEDTKVRKTVQVGPIVEDTAVLEESEKKEFEKQPNHILGVKTYFKDRGFDRVEIRPPHEYRIKGIGRQLSVWVLGRKYRHTLYVKLRDYRGTIHKLRLGRLDYLGWRKLTVTIPGWLPQSSRYALVDKNLHFVSLFVESDKHEVGGTFYFYVDALKMKVDKTQSTYPGSQIKDTW